METNKYVVMLAIVCITILEVFALRAGINGTMFTIVVAIIAGLGGYLVPSPLLKGGK